LLVVGEIVPASEGGARPITPLLSLPPSTEDLVRITTRVAYNISICLGRCIADRELFPGGCKAIAADKPIGCGAKQPQRSKPSWPAGTVQRIANLPSVPPCLAFGL
jgi:hypothetical protein